MMILIHERLRNMYTRQWVVGWTSGLRSRFLNEACEFEPLADRLGSITAHP